MTNEIILIAYGICALAVLITAGMIMEKHDKMEDVAPVAILVAVFWPLLITVVVFTLPIYLGLLIKRITT